MSHSRVVQPDGGQSFWQPVPANGHVEVKVVGGADKGMAEFDCGVQEAGDIIAESPPGNCTARPPSDPSTSYSNARPGLRLPVSPVRPPSGSIPDTVGHGVPGLQGQHPTPTTPPQGQMPTPRSPP